MPVGHPRPINPANYFGISLHRWLINRMTVPHGVLAGFDQRSFRPYAKNLLNKVAENCKVDVMLVLTKHPGHYVFVDKATYRPIAKLHKIEDKMPRPSVYTLGDVLNELKRIRTEDNEVEILELLQEMVHDLEPDVWARYEETHPWVKAVLR